MELQIASDLRTSSAQEARLRLEFLRMAQKEKERLSQFILNLWLGGTQMARKG